jgi:hypothetical protein
MPSVHELPAPTSDPRRVRCWALSPQELVGYLNQLCNPNGIAHYMHLRCEKLPDGFAVLSSFAHRDPWTIGFYIHHPSFEPVPVGEPIPRWHPGWVEMYEAPYDPPRSEPAPEPAHTTATIPR